MPREPLTRDRVLRVALEIVDESGIAALSMRGVAARLDVEAMSLYHHVSSKQALLDGLVDLVVQTAQLPTGLVDAPSWVRGSASGWRTIAREHPRLVALLSSRTLPLADPRSALPFEAGMAAFHRAGYDVRGAFAAVQSASLALLAMAELEAAGALHVDDEGSELESLDPAVFPLLHQLADSPPDIDALWEHMVSTLVRGLEIS